MARQIIVNSENKSIDIIVQARSNISVTASRAVITNGVITQINAGNNIQVNTVGTVATVSTTENITANAFYGNLVGNVVGNIVVPGVQWDVLYNDNGNAGASDNLKFDATSNVLTIVGNVIANRFETTSSGNALLYNTTLAGNNTNVAGQLNVANTIVGDRIISNSSINAVTFANIGGNLNLTTNGSAGTANVYRLKVRENVDSNLVPNVNLGYNLGNSSYRWNRLYVNDQISFGNNQSISADASRFLMSTKLYVDGSDIYNITAANITGQVGNSLVAGTVYTNAQPNITSVGTLGNVSVTGNATIGNVKTNNLLYANGSPYQFTTNAAGSNTYIQFNDGNSFGGNSQFTYDKVTNTLSVGNITANGAGLSSIAGANVTGQVSNSLTSGTVTDAAQPNITSVGTLTGLDISGSITFSNNSTISEGTTTIPGGTPVSTIEIAPAGNSYPNQRLLIYPTAVEGDHVHLTSANLQTTDIFLGDDSQFIRTTTAGGMIIGTDVPLGNLSAGYQWSFDNGGNTTFPANGTANIGNIITKSILPLANISYDIGSPTLRYKDLYLSNNTIYLGDIQITASAGGLSLPNANITTDIVVGGNATIAGNLTVSGTTEYTNVNNLYIKDPLIEIGGAANNQPLTTNDGKDRGELLHYYTTQPVDAFIGWDNSNGEFALGSNVSSSDNVVTFNTFGNLRAQHIYANINGSNVIGEVAYAATANSVAGANVNGAVTYATTANSVAGANVSGAVAYATTANSVAGANVSGAVAYATTANSVAGANVSGTVASATQSNYANIANSVAGANVSGTVANATFATTAGTVTTNAQPNITSVGTLTNLNVTGAIQGYANISGTYILGNGAFLTGVGNFSAAIGYHGSFYSNVSQTIASTTTAYPITLNNTSPGTYGVSVASNSRVTFTYAGTYNIQYSVQFTNTDNSVHNASIWLRKNGTDVPDTNSVFAVTASHGGTNGQLIGAINYIQDVNANDYYELIWQAESTSISLEYIGPGTTPTSPATPSIILTAMQVTNVQAAALSGNLTGNLIGNSYGLTGVSFVNITGNVQGNVVIGNGSGLTNLVGANVTGTVANATYATSAGSATTAGTVTTAAQPNITSTGTLTNLTVSGQITSTATTGTAPFVVASTTQVANLNVAQANIANTANSVAGANVSGQVGNSLVAGTVYTAAQGNITSVGTLTGLNVSSSINATSFTSNIATGTAPFTVTSTTQVANLNVAQSNFANTANLVAGANVSGQVGNALVAGTVYTAAQPNITSTGTLTGLVSGGVVDFTTTSNVTLGTVANLHISGGTNGYVLSTNGTGSLSWVAQSGGGGTPGGNTTELQFNNAGSFGGIAGVTYATGNLTLGAVANVKITGGSSNLFMRTDGAGNLSFQAITSNLTVGTRSTAVNIGITNYTMNVEARTGNVTVNVN